MILGEIVDLMGLIVKIPVHLMYGFIELTSHP